MEASWTDLHFAHVWNAPNAPSPVRTGCQLLRWSKSYLKPSKGDTGWRRIRVRKSICWKWKNRMGSAASLTQRAGCCGCIGGVHTPQRCDEVHRAVHEVMAKQAPRDPAHPGL